MNNDLPKPNSRVEKHLNAIATGDLTGLPKKDHSRVEQYLRYIALNRGTGEGLTEDQKDKLNKIDSISSELETLKSLKTLNIVDETLQLTEDHKQYCTMRI